MKKTKPAPVIFFSHGSPAYILEENPFSRKIRSLRDNPQTREMLDTVEDILIVSGHWLTRGLTKITGFPENDNARDNENANDKERDYENQKLEAMHDYYGFDPKYYRVGYSAPPSKLLVNFFLKNKPEISVDPSRGLDHGAWHILRLLYPDGEKPVAQVSLDTSKTFAEHYYFAKSFVELRKQNTLILASGGITHNFAHYISDSPEAPVVEAANLFDAEIREALSTKNDEKIISAKSLIPGYQSCHPDDSHYLPLIYAIANRLPDDTISFPVDGFQFGGFSQLAVMYS